MQTRFIMYIIYVIFPAFFERFCRGNKKNAWNVCRVQWVAGSPPGVPGVRNARLTHHSIISVSLPNYIALHCLFLSTNFGCICYISTTWHLFSTVVSLHIHIVLRHICLTTGSDWYLTTLSLV